MIGLHHIISALAGLAASVTLLAAAPVSTEPVGGAPPTGKLLCVGASITAGEHVTPDECYVGRLRARAVAEHVKLEVIADGRSGWSTGAFAVNAKSIAAKVPTDVTVVTILLGTNDSRSHDPADRVGAQAAANVVKLVEAYRAKIPNAEFVLIAPTAIDVPRLVPRLVKADYGPQSPAALLAIRDALRATAARMGMRFIDVSALPSAGHTVDGVHPDATGHAEIAEAVWAGLCAPAPTTRP